MKKIILIVSTLLISLFSNGTFAKDAVTKTTFKVNGNCDMCKTRIEKAAKTEGVKNAVWDQETHLLTVAFVPGKISVDQIEQNIALAGYSTDKYKADSTAYSNLPQCCQYEK